MQRYREVLGENRRHTRTMVAALRAKRESAALFRDMRQGAAAGASASATDTLLRERNSILNATRGVDGALSVAAETREALERQRQGLATSASGVGSIVMRLPGVSSLMDAIGSRQKRNDRIIAVVIALCICFGLWWAFGGRGSTAADAGVVASNAAAATPGAVVNDPAPPPTR